MAIIHLVSIVELGTSQTSKFDFDATLFLNLIAYIYYKGKERERKRESQLVVRNMYIITCL